MATNILWSIRKAASARRRSPTRSPGASSARPQGRFGNLDPRAERTTRRAARRRGRRERHRHAGFPERRHRRVCQERGYRDYPGAARHAGPEAHEAHDQGHHRGQSRLVVRNHRQQLRRQPDGRPSVPRTARSRRPARAGHRSDRGGLQAGCGAGKACV